LKKRKPRSEPTSTADLDLESRPERRKPFYSIRFDRPIYMGIITHMKTTVDIGDDLFRRAKSLAARQGTTLRALIEEGLRFVLAQRRRDEGFTLKDAAVPGYGVQSGINEGDWEQTRDLIYREPGD
jgi:hypothetical protein